MPTSRARKSSTTSRPLAKVPGAPRASAPIVLRSISAMKLLDILLSFLRTMSKVSDCATNTSFARGGVTPGFTLPFTLIPRTASICLSVWPKYMGGLSIFFHTLMAPPPWGPLPAPQSLLLPPRRVRGHREAPRPLVPRGERALHHEVVARRLHLHHAPAARLLPPPPL